MATWARRQVRPILIAVAIAAAAVAASGLWTGWRAREATTDEGKAAAAAIAQAIVAPIVRDADLVGPVSAHREREIREEIDRALRDRPAFERVRVLAPNGRALVDARGPGRDADEVARLVADAADGLATAGVVGGSFTAYVPIRPTGTALRIVELRASDGRFAAEAPWNAGVVAGAAIALLAYGASAVARRAGTTHVGAAQPLYRPAIPRRPARDAVVAAAPVRTTSPAQDLAEMRPRIARTQADATAIDARSRSIRVQVKDVLARLKDLDGRITMQENRFGIGAKQELEELRVQVRETSERLHKAELDNDVLRERMALRQQELEKLRHRLTNSTPTESETAELRLRLETAEQAAAALSRELERVETELEHTRSRFHMAMLTEALREFDNDSIEIEHDDPLEHAVVIRNGVRVNAGPRTRG